MLGRGLESLIPNKQNSAPHSTPSAVVSSEIIAVTSPPNFSQKNFTEKQEVILVPPHKIQPNPQQPRKIFDGASLDELAASIRELGIIQPLIVSKINRPVGATDEVEYQLIAGERRWRAAQKVGLAAIPVIVHAVSQAKENLEMAIVENIQRDDLNPIETARSYAKLQEEFGLTQREVAARVGKSRESVSNTLRLLNLPTFVQDAISNKKINDSQGRLLLAIEDPNRQRQLFDEISNNNLSVRELRNRISGLQRRHPTPKSLEEINKDPELKFIEERLQEALGTKVTLAQSGESGKITISFFSSEELQSLIKKLINQSRPAPFTPNDSQLI